MPAFYAALVLCIALAGCGTPGAPQAPSLHLPEPVQDLHAMRKSDKVTLTWTQPRETTDRESVAHYLGVTKICRSISSSVSGTVVSCAQPVGEVGAQKPASRAAKPQPEKNNSNAVTVEFADALSKDLENANPTQFAVYAVEAENNRGRSAGNSNQVFVPLAPTLPAPTDASAKVAAQAIVISWTAAPALALPGQLTFIYRIYRSVAENNQETAVGEAKFDSDQKIEFLDKNFEWQKIYMYRITPVTRVLEADGSTLAEVEGGDSTPIQVFANDVFPPALPAGLQAVFSGNPQNKFIDLIWNPNSESDLAGYNVYRRRKGGGFTRINSELVTTPSYRDSKVAGGHEYFYAVTAVDLRANESGRSEETSERVPDN